METTDLAAGLLNLSKPPNINNNINNNNINNNNINNNNNNNSNREDNFNSNSEGSQCGGSSNHLQWVPIALILVVPIFLVLIACCCCSCCAFCACLKPSRSDNYNNNIKSAKVYFESKPCLQSQESMDSTTTTDTTCPLFRSLTHPPPIR